MSLLIYSIYYLLLLFSSEKSSVLLTVPSLCNNKVTLGSTLANGNYLLNVKTHKGESVFHFVLA